MAQIETLEQALRATVESGLKRKAAAMTTKSIKTKIENEERAKYNTHEQADQRRFDNQVRRMLAYDPIAYNAAMGEISAQCNFVRIDGRLCERNPESGCVVRGLGLCKQHYNTLSAIDDEDAEFHQERVFAIHKAAKMAFPQYFPEPPGPVVPAQPAPLSAAETRAAQASVAQANARALADQAQQAAQAREARVAAGTPRMTRQREQRLRTAVEDRVAHSALGQALAGAAQQAADAAGLSSPSTDQLISQMLGDARLQDPPPADSMDLETPYDPDVQFVGVHQSSVPTGQQS